MTKLPMNVSAQKNTPENQPVIIGIGMLPIAEHWEIPLRNLAGRAIRMALTDAGNPNPNAIYIGNCFGNVLSHQANLGALISENAGFPGIESYTFEAAGASGAAAFRAACQAVKSGMADVAVALGVEKMTECEGSQADAAIDLTLNYEFETSQGMTALTQAALIAQRYLHVWSLDRQVFDAIAINSFRNARDNQNAFFRAINAERVTKQPIVAEPLGLLDTAFAADGAAAVVVTRQELLPKRNGSTLPISVLGGSGATAPLSIHDRHDLLQLDAVRISAAAALSKAGMALSEIETFEIWDATTIEAVLALEALGLREMGKGWQVDGLRLNLSGGCLGRGNPMGASGVYQIAESALRLRRSESNVLIQALGGCGATVITHILSSQKSSQKLS